MESSGKTVGDLFQKWIKEGEIVLWNGQIKSEMV